MSEDGPALRLFRLIATALLIASTGPLQCGVASFYGQGDGFHGLTTANGETFDGEYRRPGGNVEDLTL